MVLFIMLYKVVLTFESVRNPFFYFYFFPFFFIKQLQAFRLTFVMREQINKVTGKKTRVIAIDRGDKVNK